MKEINKNKHYVPPQPSLIRPALQHHYPTSTTTMTTKLCLILMSVKFQTVMTVTTFYLVIARTGLLILKTFTGAQIG